jgi:hypothetical protein
VRLALPLDSTSHTSYLLAGALLLGLLIIVAGIVTLFTRRRGIVQTRFKFAGVELVTTSLGALIFTGGLALVAISGTIAQTTGEVFPGSGDGGSAPPPTPAPTTSDLTWLTTLLDNQDTWITYALYVGVAALLGQAVLLLWRVFAARRRAKCEAVAKS